VQTDLSAPTDRPWHARKAQEAAEVFTSSPQGLDESDIARRLAEHGPNKLPEPKRAGLVVRFARQFNNLLIYVLLGAAAITALLGHFIDTGVILAVVLANAIIGFIQEGKAEQALDAIRDMLAPKASVLRSGRRVNIPGEDLVPGDVVLLEAGDRVPADVRLNDVRGLSIQESALTGESLPVDKRTDPVAPEAALGDRRSMAFSGTLVTAGQGRGIVVATAAKTELGRISGLIADVGTTTTPLIKKMGGFARWLTLVILVLAAIILAFGVGVAGLGFSEMFMVVVGLSVAAIPEGLPAILTVTLAIGVQGMAARKAIVRRLPAIEALGSVSVICSDKTGTLTKNEMTATALVTGDGRYTVTGGGYDPHGGFRLHGADGETEIDPRERPPVREAALAALLCSDAELQCKDGLWSVVGDPMEGALVALAEKAGHDPQSVRGRHPRTDAIPFDSKHRFMASLNHDHAGHGAVFVKGAPERLLEMCSHQRAAGGGEDPIDIDAWHTAAQSLADQGQRVLAVAVKRTDTDHTALRFSDVEGGLTLLALIGLIDPPREEAIQAVAECRSAGIRVKMITGDHAGTAKAIARQVGLANTQEVLLGSDIDRLDPDDLHIAAARVDVFARTSPEHKLRLVEALQAKGAVVAMTGDGVNDAPALKRADIGIAMGLKGTEAAKEASEMVLADDNFATIAAAVKAGRTVYENLKKAITFLLPVNGGESLSLVIAILFGLTLPIAPVQILWVNMVSSVVLAMTLAFEPAEPDIMKRPPRPAREPILSGFVVWRVIFVSILFSAGIFGLYAHARANGAEVAEARTLAVNALVVMEIFYLFSVRYLTNPSLTLRGVLGTRPVLIAVAAVTVLQFLFTYAPFMQFFFQTEPLSLLDGLKTIGVGIALLIVLEIEKRIRTMLLKTGGTTAEARTA